MELKREYQIVLEGEFYSLPKRTVAIAKKFDEFNSLSGQDDVRLHYKALEIIELLLGKEAISKLFGTTNKDDIDIISSILTLKAIDDVYLSPLKEFEEKEQEKAFNKIKEIGASVSSITSMANLSKVLK